MENIRQQALSTGGIYESIIKSGATLVGFGDVSEGLADDIKHLPKAISIALRHFPVEIIKNPRVIAYSNQLLAIDKKLEAIQKKTVSVLKGYGYKCLAIPADSFRSDNRLIAKLYPLFPHKTAATCSGLGWIGKSGLLVNEKFGARLSWATVLTNAPLEVSNTSYHTSRCGNCKCCIQICPVNAIEDWKWVRGVEKAPINYALCGEYLERNRLMLGKAVCGLCIIACPMGRGSIEEARRWRL